jgi:Rap1a immunity proteins
MAKLITLATLSAALMLGASVTRAQTIDITTTQWLYDQCREPNDSTAAIICLTYLTGVFDMMTLAESLSKGPEATPAQRTAYSFIGICVHRVTGAQLAQVFINWAARNPTTWQDPKIVGVATAFKQAWPCK